MAGSYPDSGIVDGFIRGEPEAVRRTTIYIERALSPWRDRLGYQADDVRSDASEELRVALCREQFRNDASLRTYIARIVSHTAIDYLRYNRRFVDGDGDAVFELLPAKLPNPEQALERKQLHRLLWRVVRRLPAECIKLLRMHYRDGLTCGEIGQVIQKKEDRVRRRLWECREEAKSIREKLLIPDKRL